MAYVLMEVKYWYLEHRSWGSCLYVLGGRREPVTLVILAILVILVILVILISTIVLMTGPYLGQPVPRGWLELLEAV